MQSIANLIRSFSYARQAPVMMEITRNNRFLFHVSKHSKDILRQDVRILRADLASTAFSKNTAVYGHVDENGSSVRKWTALKMAITDKCSKKRILSVNSQHNGSKFTDKSSKIGSLSVNPDEILAELVEQHCI